MSRAFVRMPSKIHTFSGRFIDPLDLRPEDVSIEDIAAHLGNQCRWSGACREFYSVAQHSVLVSKHVPPDLAPNGLLHDAAEAYLQDMAKPLKNDERLGQAYRGAEARIERVLAEVFGIVFHLPEVKEADDRMLVTEARDLVHGTTDWGYFQDVKPYPEKIVPWSPRESRRRFLKRWKEIEI